MKRACFLLRVKSALLEEYRQAHEVWPEMLAALHAAGIRNYSMYLRKDGLLVGTFEADDPQRSMEAVGKTDVNRRWQAHVAKFFESGSGDLEKGGTEWLEPYFHMD